MKGKYEICQQNSDGTWNVIAWSDTYSYASKVADALEWNEGNKYSVFKDGVRIRNVRETVA